jgi:molybdate transport system substrate-binding protein
MTFFRVSVSSRSQTSFILQCMWLFQRLQAVALLFGMTAIFAPHALHSAQNGRGILVSAAISLKNAFEEIGSIYEKQTGVRVEFNLGASGLLQKQIETGAPVDVFASAGEKQMDALQAEDMIFPETRRDMVRNALVLVVPVHSQLPLHSFADLDKTKLEWLAIGNPKTVPAGQYAQEVLRNLKLWDRLQPHLVFAENVRQVLDYVSHGEVQAGIVYTSDVLIAKGKVAIAASAPKGSHAPILYPIAVVKGTRSRGDAQRFLDLTLSKTGQGILEKYGFLRLR